MPPQTENKEQQRQRAQQICERLKAAYPNVTTALNWRNRRELLVATILSAQCTDERVNKVTKTLFPKYPTARDYAEAPIEELEQGIRPTGFFRNKAKSIQGAAQMIIEQFGGEVPHNMEDMLKLPGVARKTANVVLNEAVCPNGPYSGIAVDTHVKRVAFRLALTNQTDPLKIERDLMALVPPQDWRQVGNALIRLGREYCTARNPTHADCFLEDICPKT